MAITHTQFIRAGVEELWALTLDVEALPRITPTTMTRVQRLGDEPLAPGSRVKIKQPGQPERVWIVDTIQPPQQGVGQFRWHARTFGLTLTATHDVSEADGGSRNLLTVEFSGFGSGLAERLMRGRIGHILATENAGMRRVLEAQSPQG